MRNLEIVGEAVKALALPNVRFWIQDYYGVEARRHGPSMRQKLRAAPFAFSAPDWFGFFENLGFSPLETISTRQEALRTGRRPPFFSPRLPLRQEPVAPPLASKDRCAHLAQVPSYCKIVP